MTDKRDSQSKHVDITDINPQKVESGYQGPPPPKETRSEQQPTSPPPPPAKEEK